MSLTETDVRNLAMRFHAKLSERIVKSQSHVQAQVFKMETPLISFFVKQATSCSLALLDLSWRAKAAQFSLNHSNSSYSITLAVFKLISQHNQFPC
jgi:hypothetical protein